MIWLFLTASLAASPASVDLNLVGKWDDAADSLLDGPAGCWDVEATADRKILAVVPPDLYNSGRQYEEVVRTQIKGKLVDGIWTVYDAEKTDRGNIKDVHPLLRLMQPVAESMEIVPLIGTFPEVGQHAPTNLVREVIDEWGGDMSTSYAEWDDARQGVWLRREVPIRKRPRAPVSQVDTFFPKGLFTPTELDVAFPKSFKAGVKLMRFRIDDAQFHIRANGQPTIESASLLVVALGITMGYEQTIRYDRFTPCESAPLD